MVYVSPLTRAVQTAVIALGETMTTEDSRGEMVLMATAREKQNFGGLDSKPEMMGAAVIQRTLEELQTLYRGESAAREIIETFSKLRFDAQEVRDTWWHDGLSEPAPRVQERLQEFMSQLVYSPHRTIVVVGHSHFFRAIFKRFASPAFKAKEPALARRLGEEKLSNCGVARLELDPKSPDCPIVGVKLVFETTLVSDKRALPSCCAAPSVSPDAAFGTDGLEAIHTPRSLSRLSHGVSTPGSKEEVSTTTLLCAAGSGPSACHLAIGCSWHPPDSSLKQDGGEKS